MNPETPAHDSSIPSIEALKQEQIDHPTIEILESLKLLEEQEKKNIISNILNSMFHNVRNELFNNELINSLLTSNLQEIPKIISEFKTSTIQPDATLREII